MTRSGLFRILVVLAGVMGADGVILAAASAHQPDADAAGVGVVDAAVPRLAVLAVASLVERRIIHLQARRRGRVRLRHRRGACSPAT